VLSTADGQSAMPFVTTGTANSAFGAFALFSITTGNFNTAVGAGALDLNNGDSNTAVGTAALLLNTSGTENTAVGVDALLSNSTGNFHTAVGFGALQNCIAAPDFAGNTAVGKTALFNDTTGNFNTAIGGSALFGNTIGNVNTAIGVTALVSNTEGDSNTAVGNNALFTNTTGVQNTAAGVNALLSNDTGNNNTAIRLAALTHTTGNANTAFGSNALVNQTSGDGNVALGSAAGSAVATASNVICIGMSEAGADVSNTCFIGNIRGVTTQNPDAIPVLIDSAGQLGTTSSSARFKKDVKPMDKASEAILAFKPVTFHYKTDKTSTPQFGLIAEQVAEVNPDLVVRDKSGEVYTVRYDQVNAMLLNEFLKEHKKTEKLEATVASLIAIVKEQAAQIQKVSAQLEASKPASQVVNNNQ
jgi:trimeric autotransporter adhesin